jgi:catechol 2,3-dioxygenase-like lactoylglutathione lyase family enzyme
MPAAGPPLPRFDHLNLVVADLDRVRDFYSRVFDLTTTLDLELSGPWFEGVTGLPGAVAQCVILTGRDDPGFRIELLHYRRPAPAAPGGGTPPPPSAAGLRHFAVRVACLDACLTRARSLGAEPVGAVVEVPRSILPGGKRMVYLRDPEGVMVELAEYGPGLTA